MNLNDLTLQIEDMQGRVTQLQQQAHLKSSQPQQLNIIVTALAELGLALEELQITTNELAELVLEKLCKPNDLNAIPFCL